MKKSTTKMRGGLTRRLGEAQLAHLRRRAANRKLVVPRTQAELDAVTASDIAKLLDLSPEVAAALAAMDDDE